MQITDVAIVLNSFKYGDTSLILHCYTKTNGRQSFLSKGFYKRRNQAKSVKFPLSEVEIRFNSKSKSELKALSSIQLSKEWETIQKNPLKATISLFLAEILSLSIKESEQNLELFKFLEDGIDLLDKKSNYFSDFHLWFLLELTKYLGFYPNFSHSHLHYFDLLQGKLIENVEHQHSVLNEQETILLKRLEKLNFDLNSQNHFNQNERGILIEILLKYYKLHIPSFGKVKSLKVLKEIFR